MSSYNGHVEIVRVLIQARATVNRGKHSELSTPLVSSSKAGKLDVVRELIQAGARIDVVDYKLRNPLMAGCEAGHDTGLWVSY